METYVILRRSGEELAMAAARSTAAGEEMSDDVLWIRSYSIRRSTTAPSTRRTRSCSSTSGGTTAR